METLPSSSLPVACRLTSPARKDRCAHLEREVSPGIREVADLAGGYALRFPGEVEWLRRVAELIAFERVCCPFLRMALVAEPGGGAVWLRMEGPEGTREFLRAAFRLDDVVGE